MQGPQFPPPPHAQVRANGKAAWVISQLYYYAVCVIAVCFVIGGAIACLIGFREALLPSPGQDASASARQVLMGIAWALPFGVALFWHLREARRRDRSPVAGVFWGSALYYHLVAFVSLQVLLTGAVAALVSLINAGFAQPCSGPYDYGSCTDASSELRTALNGVIAMIVSGPVFWWHLREGRRVTRAPETREAVEGPKQ